MIDNHSEIRIRQWQNIEARLRQDSHPYFQRLLPLFYAAKENEILRHLVPYTSLTRLCFSANLEYPWSVGYPCANAAPDLDEITRLQRFKQNSDHDGAQREISGLLAWYGIAVPADLEHVFVSKEHTGIQIGGVSQAVEWVLDYTLGMYVVYSDFKQSSQLGIGDTRKAVQLLIDRIDALKR